MVTVMPKPSKTQSKHKVKPKRKVEPEIPGITTKKAYWLVLGVLLAIVSAIFGLMNGLDELRMALLIAAVVVPIGCLGYVRVSPSSLSLLKRAMFLIAGASIIGFGIWAAIALALFRAGFNEQIAYVLGEQFFIVTSLVICLFVGAFIGELIGRNKAVQIRLFNPLGEKI